MIILQGTPIAILNSLILLVTKLNEPIATPSSNITPGKITDPDPTITCFFKITLPCLTLVNSFGTVGFVKNSPE